ncbi:MAG: DUF2796 domain-containing protein [Pseudomonadota bacterium]
MRNYFIYPLLAAGLAACGGDSTPSPQNETSDAPVTEAAESAIDTQSTAPGEEAEAAENRQAGSHVHGAAQLSMALDGDTFILLLESPLYNIVGFEHAPETEEQEALLAAARTTLSDQAGLFVFSSEAGCVPDPDALVVSIGEADHHDDEDHDHEEGEEHDDDHDHDEDHHDDDEDHDHDDEHGDEAHDEDGHDDHDHGGYSDALIDYEFKCSAPDQLSVIDVKLFENFSNLEELDVVYLGPGVQSAGELTPNQTTFSLRP